MKKNLCLKLLVLFFTINAVFLVELIVLRTRFNQMSEGANNVTNTYIQIEHDFGVMSTKVQALEKRCFLLQTMGGKIPDEYIPQIGDVGYVESEELEAAIVELGDAIGRLNNPTFKEEYDIVAEACRTIISEYSNVYAIHLAGNHQEAGNYYQAVMHDPAMVQEETIATMTVELQEMVSEVQKKLKSTEAAVNSTLVASIVIMVLFCIFVSYEVLKSIRPIRTMSNDLEAMLDDMNHGRSDLSKRIITDREDEIGVLAKGINNFLETLENIIAQIRTESANIYDSVETTLDRVNVSTENIHNVTSVMDNLASNMKATNDNISSLINDTKEVDTAVTEMSTQVESGTASVKEIKAHALNIKENTESKKTSTNQIVSSIQKNVEESIEDSKNVEQIQALTSDILNIASQTNLLALNASIEAARAGESGKGFAVVADEIRQLADHSRETANHIQEISEQVVSAVGNLAEKSNEMLNYVGESVLKDYDSFVDVANQYYKDADDINEVLVSVNTTAEGLNKSLVRMSESINEISLAMNDCTTDVSKATKSADDLQDAMANIQSDAEENRKISKRLQDDVNKFVN